MRSKQSREASRRAKEQPREDNGRFLQMSSAKVKEKGSSKVVSQYEGLTATEKQAQMNIRIKGGRIEYQNFIRRTLRDSFTHQEFNAMGRTDVTLSPMDPGNHGVYYRRYDGNGVTEIGIDPKQASEDDIVHEFVHALRAGDLTRDGYAATSFKRKGKVYDPNFANKYRGDLSNIEEAATVAEAAIRTKNPAKIPSGYYDEVPGVGRDNRKIKTAYEGDRMTLLEVPDGTKIEDTKGVQGVAAVKKLNKNFDKTKISTKRINVAEGGERPVIRSAIESYRLMMLIKKK